MVRIVAFALFVALVVGCSKAPNPEPTQSPKYKDDPPQERLENALLGCMALDAASLAYTISPANTGLTDEEKLPPNIAALYEPPFGGPSFLKNGKADTIDPWGKPYELKHVKRANGSTYVLIRTTVPDGTPITQFGVDTTEEPK